MIRKSVWAVCDPPGAVGAERLLAPCTPDLEAMRRGALMWNANRLLRKTAAGQPGSVHGSRSRVRP
jgi:hypothetical protein